MAQTPMNILSPTPRTATPHVATQPFSAQRKPTFAMSADARLLYQRFAKAVVGEIVTYDDLSAVVSRKVDGSFSPLHTARRVVRREHQIVFDCVWKVGLKCLSDEEKVKLADRTATRLRKSARRGIAGLGTVLNFNGLSREGQNKHNAAISVFSVIGAMTTNASMKKMEEAVDKVRKELPTTETLKALGLA